MIPAKNRERKCSTCKHYQPSPLWRKGWCRNPLLYDRNTNHLVESESLACNRTFIDYWEPMEGPARSTTPHARLGKDGKPRIAPAIPIETVDAEGHRDVVIGNTPVAGTPTLAARSPGRPAPRRERPPLALVDEYYDEEGIGVEDDPKATREMERVGGTLHDGQ